MSSHPAQPLGSTNGLHPSALPPSRSTTTLPPSRPATTSQPTPPTPPPHPIHASSNGFVHAAIMAYNQHHHLRIRPDDIWFALLSQLGFYINARAEDLRSLFVAHNEKKQLTLVYSAGSRYTFDFGVFAQDMGDFIDDNIVNKEAEGVDDARLLHHHGNRHRCGVDPADGRDAEVFRFPVRAEMWDSIRDAAW